MLLPEKVTTALASIALGLRHTLIGVHPAVSSISYDRMSKPQHHRVKMYASTVTAFAHLYAYDLDL